MLKPFSRPRPYLLYLRAEMPEALIGWPFRGSREGGGYLVGDGVQAACL